MQQIVTRRRRRRRRRDFACENQKGCWKSQDSKEEAEAKIRKKQHPPPLLHPVSGRPPPMCFTAGKKEPPEYSNSTQLPSTPQLPSAPFYVERRTNSASTTTTFLSVRRQTFPLSLLSSEKGLFPPSQFFSCTTIFVQFFFQLFSLGFIYQYIYSPFAQQKTSAFQRESSANRRKKTNNNKYRHGFCHYFSHPALPPPPNFLSPPSSLPPSFQNSLSSTVPLHHPSPLLHPPISTPHTPHQKKNKKKTGTTQQGGAA